MFRGHLRGDCQYCACTALSRCALRLPPATSQAGLICAQLPKVGSTKRFDHMLAAYACIAAGWNALLGLQVACTSRCRLSSLTVRDAAVQGGQQRHRDFKMCITREDRQRSAGASRVRGRRTRHVFVNRERPSWHTIWISGSQTLHAVSVNLQ